MGMNNEDMQYYYFLDRLEREFTNTHYTELATEFEDNAWVFHGCEMADEIDTFRWEYDKRRFVNVRVDRKTGRIIEVIL